MEKDKRCLVIAEGTTRISKNLYKNSTCEEIMFPDTLLEIEAGAFQNCCSLQRLQLPRHIQKIGRGTFGGCTQLKEVYLPYSVVEIGHNAFEHFQIIYCETKNPPEYWYNKADEEYYSEDYAMYLDADYELWYGDWGVRASPEQPAQGTYGFQCTGNTFEKLY